jgi:hypothetical protein
LLLLTDLEINTMVHLRALFVAGLLLGLLASVAASWADEGEPPRDRVQALITDLGDPRFATREAAQRELALLGPSIVDVLNQALVAETTSAEARTRLEQVIETLRIAEYRATIQGGEPVAGIQATLRSDRARYKVGTRLVLILELANVAQEPRPCLALDVLDLVTPSGTAMGSRATGKFTIRKIPPPSSGGRWGSRSSGGEPAPATALAPGEIRKREVDAQEWLAEHQHATALEPGSYEIEFELYTQKLLSGLVNLKSNTLRIEIVAE